MNTYYDGTKLLSLMDIDGNKPEIYMVTTNRTGGKTTYFSRLCINRFKKNNELFMILYRYKYELDDCANTFFNDIGSLFFPDDIMRSVARKHGTYHELYLNDKLCGFAVAINCADQIKKISHLFNNVCRMFMDEFQSESNDYAPDELTKFQSIHTSVARGQGKQVRYVPVYMCSNPISLLNPYYVAMGISTSLKKNNKFLRGHGWVLEQGYVESAKTAQQNSGFNKAFATTSYSAYSAQGVYLNDNKTFIEKPSGVGRYIATIRFNNKEYAIREYTTRGIIYCDDHVDTSFKFKISITTDDLDINYVMLKRNDMFINHMRWYFDKGCFRFKDLLCKEAIMKMLSY